MSEEKPNESTEESNTDAAISAVFDVLVPPEEIEVYDIFGNTYRKKAVVGARIQIKILRRLEDLPEKLNFEIDGTGTDVINAIIKMASDEKVLYALSDCMAIAHPKIIKAASEIADKNDFEYEKDSPVIDLFAIEEIVASIIPLFLRLAQRGGQALGVLNNLVQKQPLKT